MAYYNKCPECGANLDPGEECDCNTITVAIKEKAPIEIAVSTGADVKKDIELSISLYYRNSKMSRRRLK